MSTHAGATPALGAAHGSAITYIGQGPKGPHVIYLREGIRITVGRDSARVERDLSSDQKATSHRERSQPCLQVMTI